jgi:tRNA(Arg) A34 adenosine deaminase TadA
MSIRKIQAALTAALTAALESNFPKQPMGCAIFEGNKIVATGCNYFCGSGHSTMHAEADAIEKLARRHGLLRPLRRMLSSIPISTEVPQYYLKAGKELQCRQGR